MCRDLSGRCGTDAAALPHASQQRAGVAGRAAAQTRTAATRHRGAGATSREARGGHGSSSAKGADLGGVPVYPSAVYLGSYDAGRGQRFHLYGVTLPYLEAVNFYRTALKVKGDELFESPPTHQFDLGRYRESDVSFPPSVTVKDYTWAAPPASRIPRPVRSPSGSPPSSRSFRLRRRRSRPTRS